MVYSSHMVLVVENRKLKGVWWKYALGLTIAQLGAWLLVAFQINPSLALTDIVSRPVIYVTFIVAALVPFVSVRLGFRRLMWCGLIGLALADAAYFTLRLYEPTRRLDPLAFISFTQVCAALVSFGIIIEFGAYVYKKVFEE